jgi:integrase
MGKLAVRETTGLAERSRLWTNLSDEELKRKAALAANERDADQLWALTEAWLATFGKAGSRVSERTVNEYRSSLRLFLEDWQDQNLLRPKRDAGVMWIRKLESEGKAPSTVWVRLAAVRMLYKALRWSGVTEKDPFKDVQVAKDKTARWDKRQPYSESDLRKLLEAASEIDTVMVLLGAHAGLRVSEMCSLEWKDINLETFIITVVKGKGGKRRKVMMSHSLKAGLEAMPYREGSRVLNFSSRRARQRMDNLCERASVQPLGVHALRHYSGTRLTKEHGGNLEPAARHLGHENLETTRIYSKFAEDTLKKSVGNW